MSAPNQTGISIHSSDNTIGGTGTSEGNAIAWNQQEGVAIADQATTGNSVRGNSIFANGGLGIDLGDNGVTVNDVGDGDTGPNLLQNMPALVGFSVVTAGVTGTLGSVPGTTFTIDFYASDEVDASGNGEGARYLESIQVITDGSGNAPIDSVLASAVTTDEYLTATATDPAGNTSEFSVAIVPGP